DYISVDVVEVFICPYVSVATTCLSVLFKFIVDQHNINDNNFFITEKRSSTTNFFGLGVGIESIYYAIIKSERIYMVQIVDCRNDILQRKNILVDIFSFLPLEVRERKKKMNNHPDCLFCLEVKTANHVDDMKKHKINPTFMLSFGITLLHHLTISITFSFTSNITLLYFYLIITCHNRQEEIDSLCLKVHDLVLFGKMGVLCYVL
ncbi:hypothetical protein ACJX0J_036824, partial [Zea mays]